MADSTYSFVYPDLKSKDLGDDTNAMSVQSVTVPAGGIDKVFRHLGVPLKAVDLSDGTYALAARLV